VDKRRDVSATMAQPLCSSKVLFSYSVRIKFTGTHMGLPAVDHRVAIVMWLTPRKSPAMINIVLILQHLLKWKTHRYPLEPTLLTIRRSGQCLPAMSQKANDIMLLSCQRVQEPTADSVFPTDQA
jgi:hypothetical protein